jgi:hypothetical protein
MKFTILSTGALLLSALNVIAHPQPYTNDISLRDAHPEQQRDTSDIFEDINRLFKRKGGGGGGGKGGGGGGKGGTGGTGGYVQSSILLNTGSGGSSAQASRFCFGSSGSCRRGSSSSR